MCVGITGIRRQEFFSVAVRPVILGIGVCVAALRGGHDACFSVTGTEQRIYFSGQFSQRVRRKNLWCCFFALRCGYGGRIFQKRQQQKKDNREAKHKHYKFTGIFGFVAYGHMHSWLNGIYIKFNRF